jgi:hypothetical protein
LWAEFGHDLWKVYFANFGGTSGEFWNTVQFICPHARSRSGTSLESFPPKFPRNLEVGVSAVQRPCQTSDYDHWLEIRRELVLFPKIFRQFSEFAPTKYSGDFGIQREIRPKFGNSSRRISDQILKYTRLQVTISLHIRNWVLVSYGGIVGQ